MATQTPRRPEEEIHGEATPRPLFGPGSDESKSASPEALSAAEKAGGKSPEKAASPELNALGDALGKGFNPLDSFKGSPLKRALGLLSRNKKKAAGGAIGGGLIGGGIFMLSIVQGPLQFIHFAQLLQKYHFSSVYDATDDRFGKLGRYIYHSSSGQVERTRLGYFQNKYADRIDGKLRAAGMESEYNSRLGYKNRTRVTQQFFGQGNLSAEEIKLRIDAEFSGAKTYIEDGKVYINNRDMGYFKNRSFERQALTKAGYSKIMAAVNGRVMSKRAGYVLHPFKKLDRKVLEKFDDAYEKWKKERKEKINRGADGVSRQAKAQGKEGQTEEETSRNQQGAKDGADKVNGDIEKFRQSGTFRALGGGTALISMGCLAKSLDDGYGEIKEQQVIAPLIRTALDVISVGAQVQSGDDLDIQQLDFMNRQMHSKDKDGRETSFYQATSLLGEEGKRDKGTEESETLKGIGKSSPFAFVNTAGLKEGLGAVCSTAGQIIQVTISLVAAPISTAATAPLSIFLGPKIEEALLSHLIGEVVNPLAVGAELGNNANYGARLAANSQMSSNGGQPLSGSEEQQLARLQAQEERIEHESESFFARMFNVYDHRSFVSKLVYKTKPLDTQNISQVASGILSPASVFNSTFSALTSKAQADTYRYDYGFPEVGFSLSEMTDPSVENPYTNAEKVVNDILPGNKKYIKKAEKCFGVKIDSSTYEVTPLLDKTPTFKDVNGKDCKDGNKKWMQVRMYIFDSNIALSASCYEGDKGACSELGIDTGSSSASTASGSSASCEQPSGTPKDVIDNVVVPMAQDIGFEISAESVEAANAAHSLTTTSGNVSDHSGPPERAWAADISNGSNPTPEMDELTKALAGCFELPPEHWEGNLEGRDNQCNSVASRGGYRFQLIYRTSCGGNHYNHVHIGVSAG